MSSYPEYRLRQIIRGEVASFLRSLPLQLFAGRVDVPDADSLDEFAALVERTVEKARQNREELTRALGKVIAIGYPARFADWEPIHELPI